MSKKNSYDSMRILSKEPTSSKTMTTVPCALLANVCKQKVRARHTKIPHKMYSSVRNFHHFPATETQLVRRIFERHSQVRLTASIDNDVYQCMSHGLQSGDTCNMPMKNIECRKTPICYPYEYIIAAAKKPQKRQVCKGHDASSISRKT